ncbi:MAG: hypothetical protein WC931_02105 [Bacilli bacterium]|jgi:hypothetical protein
MNKKYLSLTVAIAVIGTMVAAPAFAALRAQTGERVNTTTPRIGEMFCSGFATMNRAKNTKMLELENKLTAKRGEQGEKLEKNRVKNEGALAEKRTVQDEKRLAGYEKLLGHAASDEQKAAVEKLQSTMEAAVVARRAAVDAAIAVYRSGMDKLIADRKAGMDAALTVYKASIKAAEQKAAADCSAGVDPATVRTNLKSATDAARIKYKSDRETVIKISDQVRALGDARKAAFETALNDFKTALEAAKNELKAVFPVKTAASTPAT